MGAVRPTPEELAVRGPWETHGPSTGCDASSLGGEPARGGSLSEEVEEASGQQRLQTLRSGPASLRGKLHTCPFLLTSRYAVTMSTLESLGTSRSWTGSARAGGSGGVARARQEGVPSFGTKEVAEASARN